MQVIFGNFIERIFQVRLSLQSKVPRKVGVSLVSKCQIDKYPNNIHMQENVQVGRNLGNYQDDRARALIKHRKERFGCRLSVFRLTGNQTLNRYIFFFLMVPW